MKEERPGFRSGGSGEQNETGSNDQGEAGGGNAASATSGAPGAGGSGAGANRLAGESSLYLRQHQHNPVNWWPWRQEALAQAKREDKPLLVSIGYSACHWCHVMERESFENEDIAALMNAHFVCIKVDREERPDVDQIYMDAVTRLTGHGGWPLTVFCKPDGTPYYGGTYFPPEDRSGMPGFPRVLEAMQRAFRHDRAQVDENARRIMAAISAQPRGEAPAPGPQELHAAARDLLRGADLAHGGFGGAPKFPTPALLELLLAGCDLFDAEERQRALHHLAFTCRQMSTRGLYDPLGGGFHRYCVDHHWGVPHFEKMLYDQAQLLRCYADAWRRSGAAQGDDLLWPIRETATYLRREMQSDEGGLYASQDADSEGVEGKFYVWTPQEVHAALGAEQGQRFCAAYGVTTPGNFEGSSVLWDQGGEPHAALAEARATLLAVRARRIPPATDTKCILGWNALAVSGLAYAGSVCDDNELIDDALRTARFIERRLLQEDGARRIFAEGRASGDAFLDDFAAWLAACLDLYRANADAHWLKQALRAAEVIKNSFFDADENDFFLTPAHATGLPLRPRTGHDGATPEPGAQAVLGLLRTAELCGRPELRQTAERVLQSRAFAVRRAPGAFPTLLRAAARAQSSANTAVIVGAPENAATLALAARRALAPEDAVLLCAPGAAPPAELDRTWFAGRDALSGEAAAYLCRGVECSLPFTQPERFAELLEEAPGQ